MMSTFAHPRIPQACMLIISLLLLGVDGANSVRRLPGFPGELPFKLETGYVGVGEYEKVQLFYYFVESQRDPVKDPLIHWHTGGPGCSVLTALLYEIGPIQFDFKSFNGSIPPLILNPYTSTKVANVIFLDAPVGTGFSYSETDQDYYIKDDIAAADANYQFLRKGYILGNPTTDTVIDGSMSVPFAHRLGLISDELYESFKISCGSEYLYPDINSTLCLEAQKAIEKVMLHEPNCNFAPEVNHLETEGTYVSINNVIDALQGKKAMLFNYVPSYIWANDPGVQEALHVRKGTKDYWGRCNGTLKNAYSSDVVSSVVDYHRSFFNSGYRALIYSGDHDMIVPYMGTMKWIASLNLTQTDPWRPWMVDGLAAGFTRTFQYEDTYELTFATVKGAGHVAIEFKPKPCPEMLHRWLAHSKL